ncbi:MAG: ABC-type lipoprotein release transport system permease subunit [Glaciecola sp.]|jgi:ABC-type lipoprotein release transport system permease subunit|uniref:ABC transporter permease n=1 Tax=Congregibacter sp. TaxID=2744308 RepID=UPI0039E3CE61
MSDRISQLAVTGDNYRSVSVWLGGLRAAAGDVVTLPWNELDSFLGTMLGVQDGFALIFTLVIFAVLSFGLVNTLVMAVFERTREIGLMQALGMSPRLIIAQVMLESAFLLFVGLCIGCLIGVGTLLLLRDGIGGLDRPDEGQITVEGQRLDQLSSNALAKASALHWLSLRTTATELRQ